MADFDPKAIREALQGRNVALNPPASDDALGELARWAGGGLQDDIVRLLREFDGFADGDFEADSFLSVWSIDRSLRHRWTSRPILAFADWSLNSLIFGFDPCSDGSVISIEDHRCVAPTYAEFWPRLLSDRLVW